MKINQKQKIELTVAQQDAGIRLDKFVAEASSLTRTMAQSLIAQGHVLVNGKAVVKKYLLQIDDVLSVEIPPPKDIDLSAQDIPIDIVYEDDHLIVVNKPKGMVVHPAAGNLDGTLVNALMYHCKGRLSGIGGEIRPGIVHRIDKDTSGLLVVAKDDETHNGLAAQFACHSVSRCYNAVAIGRLPHSSGIIDAPIGRDPAERKRMAADVAHGKNAVTHYTVLQEYRGYSYISLQLETGRTHQIRVHMKKIGHPLAGDAVYGPVKNKYGLQGQCLHAKTLGFVHPVLGKHMEFDSELPAYFKAFLERLERDTGI